MRLEITQRLSALLVAARDETRKQWCNGTRSTDDLPRTIDEDAIAGKEEVLSGPARESCGPQLFGLHESDGDESVTVVCVECQSGRDEGIEHLGREGVGEHEAVPEVGHHRDRVPLELVGNTSSSHYVSTY